MRFIEGPIKDYFLQYPQAQFYKLQKKIITARYLALITKRCYPCKKFGSFVKLESSLKWHSQSFFHVALYFWFYLLLELVEQI